METNVTILTNLITIIFIGMFSRDKNVCFNNKKTSSLGSSSFGSHVVRVTNREFFLMQSGNKAIIPRAYDNQRICRWKRQHAVLFAPNVA